MLLFDTGIFQRVLGLNIGELIISDDFDVINKGAIAELFTGLELQKSASPYQQASDVLLRILAGMIRSVSFRFMQSPICGLHIPDFRFSRSVNEYLVL